MARLNLTLDEDTLRHLERAARRAGKPRSEMARELLRDTLARREAAERQKKLAADYARGREDDAQLLAELEAGQLEIMGDEAF